HHVVQASPKSRHGRKPPSASDVTPIVALSIVHNRPANAANVNTSRGRSKNRWLEAKRRTSHAPATASSVLPVAIPNDVARLPAVDAFAANAPSQIPSHARGPNKSSAASAMPVGGHTGDALACTNARLRP